MLADWKRIIKQGWAQDVNGRDRDETKTLAVRDRDETETLTVFVETRPRRDVDTSRDRDHHPVIKHRLKVVQFVYSLCANRPSHALINHIIEINGFHM